MGTAYVSGMGKGVSDKNMRTVSGEKRLKVLYLYSGTRKDKFAGKASVDYPDTQLYGLNHLHEFGIHASFKEPPEILRRIFGFRLIHAFSFFFSFGYDIVFGASLMYMLFWKRFIPTRTRFVILNFSLVRLFESNKDNPLKLKCIHFLLKGADAVVNVSEWQQDYLERVCPYLKGKMYVVFGNVDTDFYQSGTERNKNYFAVGRDNGRDYNTLIEAAKRLPEVQFVIACSERNLESVKEVPNNVTAHFDFRYPQVKEALEKSRAMLLITHPDKHFEGADCSGQTVLMEAMASGIPVIMTRKAYLPEYADDGEEILTVAPYDVDGIVSCIQRLEEDAELRIRMGRLARSRAERDLSSKKMGERLARVFQSVCERTEDAK